MRMETFSVLLSTQFPKSKSRDLVNTEWMNAWGLHHKIKQHEGQWYMILAIYRDVTVTHFVAFYKLKIPFSCLTFCDFCNHPLDSRGCVLHCLPGKAETWAGKWLSCEEQRWRVRTIHDSDILFLSFPFKSYHKPAPQSVEGPCAHVKR